MLVEHVFHPVNTQTLALDGVLPAIVRGKSLRLPYDGFWEAFTPRKTYGP
jgi:hypothetical protein